ncbi:MAG TPA: hypothetical protein VGK97_11805 [Spongiibacteraceae bacterium]
MHRPTRIHTAVLLFAGIVSAASFAMADADPIVFSFSTVGDSRQDPAAPDPTTTPLSGQDAKWLQNTKAFSRILRTIQTQKPNALFFNGDMVMGYGKASLPTITASTTPSSLMFGSDLGQFYVQYAYWRGMVAPVMETGTYIVPVPGNHEVQSKALGKKAQVENENAWRDNMGDLIVDSSRWSGMSLPALTNFSASNNPYTDAAIRAADGITTDQSQLSYSFDVGDSHFAIVNTDPVGHDSHAPTTWLAGDFAAAQTRGAHHYFVFGHKPAYTYYFGATTQLPAGAPSSLDADIPARDAFWNVIETYHATYFCGHEHTFNASQPNAANGGSAWQILVGSGGSPFDAKPTDSTINPATDRKYAWATVKIHQSGSINIDVYGFSDAYGPTQVLKSIVLPY